MNLDRYARHIIVTANATVAALAPYYGQYKWFALIATVAVVLAAAVIPSGSVPPPVVSPSAVKDAEGQGFDTGNRHGQSPPA